MKPANFEFFLQLSTTSLKQLKVEMTNIKINLGLLVQNIPLKFQLISNSCIILIFSKQFFFSQYSGTVNEDQINLSLEIKTFHQTFIYFKKCVSFSSGNQRVNNGQTYISFRKWPVPFGSRNLCGIITPTEWTNGGQPCFILVLLVLKTKLLQNGQSCFHFGLACIENLKPCIWPLLY